MTPCVMEAFAPILTHARQRAVIDRVGKMHGGTDTEGTE